MDLDNCKQFILDVLKQKGACKMEDLLEACKLIANCPKKIKTLSVDDFKAVLETQTEVFAIKNGKVCSVQWEKKFADRLISALEKEESLSVNNAVDLLKECDPATFKYIQSLGVTAGVNEFLARNRELFRVKNEKILPLTKTVLTEKHAKAVKYFLDVLSKKGELSITALSGHLNQASSEVKSIVKSTNPTVFKKFLSENSYYFQVNYDMVRKRSSDNNSLHILVEGDELVCKTVNYFVQKLAIKGKQILPQLVSSVNLDKDAEIIGTIGSRKQGDIEEFLRSHPSVFHFEGNEVSLCHEHAEAVAAFPPVTVTKEAANLHGSSRSDRNDSSSKLQELVAPRKSSSSSDSTRNEIPTTGLFSHF